MSTTLKVWSQFSMVGADGATYRQGSLTTPTEITVDGMIDTGARTVTGTSAITLFDASLAGNLADFDYMRLYTADSGWLIELYTDANNGVGDEVYVVELEEGVAFQLGSDLGIANWASSFTGTNDVIDKVLAKNTLASGSAPKTIHSTFIT